MDLRLTERPFKDRLIVARGGAIQAYANVEQSLGGLFAALIGVPEPVAGIAFFRMTSARQRNKVIELLIQKKFGDHYSSYWHGLPGTPGNSRKSGILALIRNLDEIRNKIVHWIPMTEIADTGEPREDYLIRPNIWEFFQDQKTVTVSEIVEFIERADFVSRAINLFSWYCVEDSSDLPEVELQKWRDMFQQPFVYPVDNAHPLSRHYVRSPR